jgi:hypothetical protein
MNLLSLAPDIQEALLLTEITDGRDWVTAKRLLPIARCASWAEQRRLFGLIRAAPRRAQQLSSKKAVALG